MNMRFVNVPKRFKAMSALVLLHGGLIVIDNLRYTPEVGFPPLLVLIILLEVVVSLLIGYLVLTGRLLVILGVSLLFAYLLSYGIQIYASSWPPIDILGLLQNPYRTLPNIIYLLEAIIPIFGVVILFMGIRERVRVSRA